MPIKNLWGELPQADEVQSPASLLRGQAEILSEQTNGFLSGDVTTEAINDEIVTEFFVVAPFLNNYRVGILRIRHSALMYPLKITNLLKDRYSSIECTDAKALEDEIARILNSTEVHQIISSLFTQSQK